MEDWTLNWTGFVLVNKDSEIEGLRYEDGPEWIQVMFELWKSHSDHGRRYQEQRLKDLK